jgi:predicted nucleic acid-binding Zn ribbon protein
MSSDGPEPLRDILARLFTARGWARRQERLQVETVWALVAGPEVAGQTQVQSFRRGILEVIVANAVLLQELVHFRRRQLLEQLRQRLPGAAVNELRFRTGVVKKN